MNDERKTSAIPFLEAAAAYYASLGVKVERVMTDNGSCYLSRAFGQACRKLGIRHIRTKPYTPKTNGKAQRFIQTSLREWAYARAYDTSDQRASELPRWLHSYNWHRPHGSIGSKPPISRIGLTANNPLRLHIATVAGGYPSGRRGRRRGPASCRRCSRRRIRPRSEVADGDSPHVPGACPFQAWWLRELIHMRRLLGDTVPPGPA